jgi:hypothetical protein
MSVTIAAATETTASTAATTTVTAAVATTVAVPYYKSWPVGTKIHSIDGDDDDPDNKGMIQCKVGDKLHNGRCKLLSLETSPHLSLTLCFLGYIVEVLALAGQGAFGTVLDVFDHHHKGVLALKVIRSVKRYAEAAYIEADVVARLNFADPLKQSYASSPTHRSISLIFFAWYVIFCLVCGGMWLYVVCGCM